MESELQVAIDVGSRVHRVAVSDADGHVLDQFDVHHTARGIDAFFSRITPLAHGTVAVAMEGYNGWARPLDQRILAQGWALYNVNNLKLARYKEIFPAPAKSDNIDSLRTLELFRMRQSNHLARDVLQLVVAAPAENDKLKHLTRRRRQLVNDKVRLIARLVAALQALCPGLLALTGAVDNVWFLSLLTARADVRKLARLRGATLRGLPGIGKKYVALIQVWQADAMFADDVEWTGPTAISDARRLLALRREIEDLERQIAAISVKSELAQRIASIPGFGLVCSAELAGEIGDLARFSGETGLAVYLGMAPLTNSSGTFHGTKRPRQVNRHAKMAMMNAVAHHAKLVEQSLALLYEKARRGESPQPSDSLCRPTTGTSYLVDGKAWTGLSKRAASDRRCLTSILAEPKYLSAITGVSRSYAVPCRPRAGCRVHPRQAHTNGPSPMPAHWRRHCAKFLMKSR